MKRNRQRPQASLFGGDDGIGVLYFASGSNHPGEIRGFASISRAVGVSAAALDKKTKRWRSQCGADCQAALVEAVDAGVPVFIDSGAFSEVDFGPRGPVTVAPIEPEEWDRRLEVYRSVIGRVRPPFRGLVNVVAPDKVGDYATTMARLKTYRPQLEELSELGGTVLVPLHRGPRGLADTHRQVEDLLAPIPWVPALPMMKAATSSPELASYLEAIQPERVHLLGIGPRNPRAREVADVFLRYGPATRVQADSVAMLADLGRTGGPAELGGVRRLTAAQDAADAEFAEYRFDSYPREFRDRSGIGGLPAFGDTEAELDWLSPAARRRTGQALGLNRAAIRAWVADPDQASQLGWSFDTDGRIALEETSDGPALYELPDFYDVLRLEWERYARKAETAERKRAAIAAVYGRSPGFEQRFRNPPGPQMDRFLAQLEPDWRTAVAAVPELPDLWVELDEAAGDGARQFAFYETGSSPRIAFAPKTVLEPWHRQQGLWRHELGHAVHACLGRAELQRRMGERLAVSDERLADQVARWIFGEPILYDSDTVQSSRDGRPGRPPHLG